MTQMYGGDRNLCKILGHLPIICVGHMGLSIECFIAHDFKLPSYLWQKFGQALL